MKRIKFGEVKVSETARKHINECLDNNQVTMGEKSFLFERKWRELFGYKFSRFMSSGTTAGTACAMSLYEFGAKPGDEVIVPALSFIATSNAVRMAGLTPVFVDIDRKTLNINEDLIESKITNKTRAIKVVNTMGRPCRMDVIKNIAEKHNLMVIVDNCEAYGAKYKGKYCLEYADMETSSHYAAHLIISAEGSMVSTNSSKIDRILEAVRSHGRTGGSLYFNHEMFGGNFKNTDLHASIGLGEIEVFWENFNIRHDNMMKLHKGLEKHKDKFWSSEEDDDCVNCPHGFSITLKDKSLDINKLKTDLDGAGIDYKRNFGCIPTQHRSFSDYGYKLGSFPESEWVGENGIHLGVHRYLSNDDIEYMIMIISRFFENG